VAEVPHEELGAVQTVGEDQLRLGVEEVEVVREDPDDFVGLPVDRDGPADDAGVAAELALPVAVRQDDAVRRLRGVVLGREETPERRRDVQHAAEDAVGDVEDLGALRVSGAGDRYVAAVPDPCLGEGA
jgi:hypothetical protein